MANRNPEKYIGVDLGGTKVHSGIVLSDGTIIKTNRQIFQKPENDKKILSTIKESIGLLLTEDIKSIGIGIPAVPDGQRGNNTTNSSPNLKLLEHMDIIEYIQKVFKKPVLLENDANCFILGEHKCGVAKRYNDCVGLTLGTGIGCGIILGGKIRCGLTGHCGEVFDIPIDNGILEDKLSGKYVAKMAKAKDVFQAVSFAKAGNKEAIVAWSNYGKWLGWLIKVIQRIIDPHLYVLGGSLSYAYNLFYKEMKEMTGTDIPPIVVSELKEKAAIIGAALQERKV